MGRWKPLVQSLFALVLLATAGPASAQTVLVSNLANTNGGFDTIDPTGVWVAQSFQTDGAAHTLHSFDASLTFADGGLPSQITATLFSADGLGEVATPVKVLGSASSLGGDVYRFTGDDFHLAASTKYWVVLSKTGTGDGRWSYTFDTSETGPGSIPASKAIAISFSSGAAWSYQGLSAGPYRFQVNVDGASPEAVPEPGAVLLFLPTLGAVALLRRRTV